MIGPNIKPVSHWKSFRPSELQSFSVTCPVSRTCPLIGLWTGENANRRVKLSVFHVIQHFDHKSRLLLLVSHILVCYGIFQPEIWHYIVQSVNSFCNAHPSRCRKWSAPKQSFTCTDFCHTWQTDTHTHTLVETHFLSAQHLHNTHPTASSRDRCCVCTSASVWFYMYATEFTATKMVRWWIRWNFCCTPEALCKVVLPDRMILDMEVMEGLRFFSTLSLIQTSDWRVTFCTVDD